MPVIQKHRLLAIGTALGDDALLLTQFSMNEQLGRLFHLEAGLASENPEVDFDKIVGSNATIRLEMPDGKTRYFNGYVSRFVQTGEEDGFARYRATLVPWFWFLTRTSDCRIFQKKKVPDIIEEVFKAHGFKDYKLKLSGSYPEWEYCVQYRESDFNFVSRLMEQEGIYYFFHHEDGVHTMILADAPSAHEEFEDYGTLTYRTPEHGAGDATEESITDWVIEKEVQPGVYALSDFNFKNPGAPIVVNANINRKHEAASFEMFDYPGEYDDRGSGEAYAKIRIQELQAQHEILRGQATVRGICPGFKFTLKGHPRDDQNRAYLITGATCHAGASLFESSGQGNGEGFYTCSLTAIPAAEHFRSSRTTPKPVIQGPQTAIVVGKEGEEIDTDEFGRVKVQFHWDRYGKVDENSSCWVRVSQNVAGKGWGAITIPRIGQEVIVEFLEGDPDQPIITGRVYNATAKVPYDLPGEKTKSTLKTNSSKGGGGFNEIRIEDKKGSEQIFIHGQKDEDVRIQNDAREFIGNERHLIVKKNQFENVKEGDKHSLVKGNRLAKTEGDHGETIGGDHLASVKGDDNLTVKGDQKIKVDGDQSQKVGGNWNNEAGQKISIKAGQDFHEKAGMNYAMDAGMNVHIKGGMVVVIEAGVQLSLKAGGNFVDIGPAGVAIQGTMVMINSGGAAGSGSGSSPTAPVAPDDPDPPKEAKEAATAKAGEVDEVLSAPRPPKPVTYSATAKVLKYAAEDGTPFCEECAKAAAEEETAEELAVITKIAWLDGADDKELSGDDVQWVNIPHDAKWVDAPNKLTNKDRFGQKVRYKVTFSKPGSHKFKVKVVPGDDNVVYSTAEKGRDANFKWMDQEKDYTTGSDGTKIVESDFFTAAAGGDTFKLVAEDTENSPPVETSFLHTRRLAYVVVVKMKDMTSNADLGTFKSEYLKQGIELVELPAVEMDRMANIGPDEEDTFKQKCKAAFDGSKGKAKAPYAVAIGFTEHLAVKNANQDLELTGVDVGPDKLAVEIPVQARGLRDGDGLKTRKLWKDLVPGEGWFISCKYTPDGGGAAQNVAEADCTALPEGRSSCGKVRVDVTKLPAGKGTIKLRVNVVDRMRGGLSFPGGNLICVCTKAWWKENEAAIQSSTLVHEMGHKVGMVSDGSGKKPDKVETFYEAKGHVGPHCFFDLGDQTTYAGVTGNQCVMFGAVGAGSPTAFCVKCTPAVRKMDLSAGWPPA